MIEIEDILKKASFEELTEISKYLKIENGDIYEIWKKFKDNHDEFIYKIIKYIRSSGKGIFDKIFESDKKLSYYEILTKVLDKFEISYSKNLNTKELEEKFLYYFLENLDKFPKEELAKIILTLNNKDIERILKKVNQSKNIYHLAGEAGFILFLIDKLIENIGENYSKLIPTIALLIKLRLKYDS